MMFWIDSHCHLDAAEFDADRAAVRARARAAGVGLCVIPAVAPEHFERVRALAHAHGDAYCLGIHPLYVGQCTDDALHVLEDCAHRALDDPRFVAIGEMGLDLFVPELASGAMLERQVCFFRAQLQLARRLQLPVVLHVRRAVDPVLAHLRQIAGADAQWSGIAHAFAGSEVQAARYQRQGLKLGAGGAMTFDRAKRLRTLLGSLPDAALVLETDAPDMPPRWRYVDAQQRRLGAAAGRNEPADLVGIADAIAQLRGQSVADLMACSMHNVLQALPRLASLLGYNPAPGPERVRWTPTP